MAPDAAADTGAPRPVCRHWLQGRCKQGGRCCFLHTPPAAETLDNTTPEDGPSGRDSGWAQRPGVEADIGEARAETWTDLLTCVQVISDAKQWMSLPPPDVGALEEQARAQDFLDEVAAMLPAVAPDVYED